MNYTVANLMEKLQLIFLNHNKRKKNKLNDYFVMLESKIEEYNNNAFKCSNRNLTASAQHWRGMADSIEMILNDLEMILEGS